MKPISIFKLFIYTHYAIHKYRNLRLFHNINNINEKTALTYDKVHRFGSILV
jgi:hypothetical protein